MGHSTKSPPALTSHATNDELLPNCCHRVPLLIEDRQRPDMVDSEPPSESHLICAQFYEERIEPMRQLFSEVSYCY